VSLELLVGPGRKDKLRALRQGTRQRTQEPARQRKSSQWPASQQFEQENKVLLDYNPKHKHNILEPILIQIIFIYNKWGEETVSCAEEVHVLMQIYVAALHSPVVHTSPSGK
jgi:hypothetical protein